LFHNWFHFALLLQIYDNEISQGSNYYPAELKLVMT